MISLVSRLKDQLYRISPGLTLRLISIYLARRPGRRSFAQKGEDLFCAFYLKNVKNGRYLDIGAYHPKFISNTYLLHKAGWSGVAVDISAYKIDEMKRFRRGRVTCVQAAIVGSAEQETAEAYFFDKPWSDLDTLSHDIAESRAASGGLTYKTKTIPIKSINELLEEVGPFDFVNIDIEGLDRDLLLALDFNRFRPRLICYEDNAAPAEEDIVATRLRAFGYRLVFSLRGSICFALFDAEEKAV